MSVTMEDARLHSEYGDSAHIERRTSIGGDLGSPLHFLILVRTLPAPAINPLLLLLVPDLLIPPLLLDTLRLRELLPLGRWLWLR